METTTPRSSRSVEKALFIRAIPERVFHSLTDPSELEKWFVGKAKVDLRPGGALKFTWREGQEAAGEFLIVDPPHRLSFRWQMDENLGETIVTIELTPEGAGTQLRLVETGWGNGDDWDRLYNAVDPGWSFFFGRMVAWLEEGKEAAAL